MTVIFFFFSFSMSLASSAFFYFSISMSMSSPTLSLISALSKNELAEPNTLFFLIFCGDLGINVGSSSKSSSVLISSSWMSASLIFYIFCCNFLFSNISSFFVSLESRSFSMMLCISKFLHLKHLFLYKSGYPVVILWQSLHSYDFKLILSDILDLKNPT